MGRLANVFANFAPGLKASPGPPPYLAAESERARWTMPDLGVYGNQARAYGTSGAVFFCVTRIAEAAAQVAFNVFQRKEESLEPIRNHPFELLLQHSNPKMTRFALMESTVAFLELTGNAYWWLNTVGATVVEIWPLRSDRVKPVPDPVDYVKGYVYEIDGRKIPLEPGNVVHFKRFNPLNDYVGMSAIEAAALNIQRDTSGQKWSVGFFKNNAMPASAVLFKATIPDGEWERIKKEWRVSYQGAENAYKTAMIRGTAGDVDVKSLGIPQHDMQFLESHQADWKDISLIYGIPLGKWSENATMANALVADVTFWGETMTPKLERVSQQITADLLLPYYGQDLVGRFDAMRPRDRQLEINELRWILRGNADGSNIMTTDEVRAHYFDMPPLVAGLPSGEEQAGANVVSDGEPKAGGATDAPPPSAPLPSDVMKARDEEGQWQRWAVKRVKAGKPLDGFLALHVGRERRAEIKTALVEAKTAEEVRAAFEPSPFRLESYP